MVALSLVLLLFTIHIGTVWTVIVVKRGWPWLPPFVFVSTWLALAALQSLASAGHLEPGYANLALVFFAPMSWVMTVFAAAGCAGNG